MYVSVLGLEIAGVSLDHDLQNLRRRKSFGVSDLLQSLVFRQWRVCRPKTRIRGGVNAFRLAVIQQLWRWAIRMQFDLIDCRHCLAARIVEKLL